VETAAPDGQRRGDGGHRDDRGRNRERPDRRPLEAPVGGTFHRQSQPQPTGDTLGDKSRSRLRYSEVRIFFRHFLHPCKRDSGYRYCHKTFDPRFLFLPTPSHTYIEVVLDIISITGTVC
jgi:hypothetical protein